MFFQETWHEEMTKGLFDDGSSSDEGIGSDGEGVEVKAPVLAERRKTRKTKRKEAERKAEVKTDVSLTNKYTHVVYNILVPYLLV